MPYLMLPVSVLFETRRLTLVEDDCQGLVRVVVADTVAGLVLWTRERHAPQDILRLDRQL